MQSGLFGTVLSYGIYFWWYRFFKNIFYQNFKKSRLNDIDITIITLASGCINTFLTNPIWFINTRMSVSKDNKSIFSTVKDVYKTEGFVAFYKGILPNLILLVNPIINFVIYEA